MIRDIGIESIISWSVTIVIAISGWIVACIQTHRKRKSEQANKLADRRFEAYNNFWRKMDDISEEMNKIPQSIMNEMTTTYLTSVLEDSDNTNEALLSFNQKLITFVTDSLKPMMIMKQELSSLRLVSSEQMNVLIKRMQDLTDDMYNEYYSCLSTVSPNDSNSFQNLKSIGQSQRLKEFTALYNEMTDLMRKEIQLS